MYEDEGYKLMGAAFEVFNQLGYGMAEEVYQQCLEIELKHRGIAFRTKHRLSLAYKGKPIEKVYIPDLFVFDAIVVELKAAKELSPDLIILDVMMPEAGGVTMYRELKTDQALKDIPVIMLTGIGEKSFSHYLKMLNLKRKDPIPQPDAHMEKPLDHVKLLELAKKIIG